MNTVFLEKICRCCLNESEDMINVFDCVIGFEPFTFESHFTYSDLIYLCTNVRCDMDVVDATNQVVELPRNVCDYCLQELRATFIFRQKCENSDHLLREQTVQLGNQFTEEVVEFEQPINGRKCEQLLEINTVGNNIVKELELQEGLQDSDRIKEEQNPILVTTYEKIPLENQSNQVEVQIVSIEPDDRLNLPFKTEELSNINPINDQISNSEYSCKKCEIPFLCEFDLQSHDQQQHHQNKKYKCKECSKEFRTEKGFLTHLSCHRNRKVQKKFLCSTCGNLFATRQRLKVHIATHTGEKSHMCAECDKTFSSQSRLRCHLRTKKNSSDQTFTQIVLNMYNYTINTTGEKPFKCDQCSLTFAQGNALRCHKRIHTGEKPYECNICSKRFTQNTILKTHMTLHTGKTIKCPDCSKMFSRASNLILHRREHTGEKPYECLRCPNRYKQKSHLDRHMDTHLGVKHICEICQRVYSKRWSLKVHMFSQHSKTKPHKCSVCSAEFARRDKYTHHLKSIHGLTSVDILNASNITEISIQKLKETAK